MLLALLSDRQSAKALEEIREILGNSLAAHAAQVAAQVSTESGAQVSRVVDEVNRNFAAALAAHAVQVSANNAAQWAATERLLVALMGNSPPAHAASAVPGCVSEESSQPNVRETVV
jgi:hypothetical protein